MSTSFFEQQDEAHRQTGRLIGYFVLAVISIIAAIYLAITLIYAVGTRGADAQPNQLFDLGRLTAISSSVLLVIATGTLYKIAALNEGGAAVARLFGAELVNPANARLAERRLLNVVEEMAIAAGVPVPSVYILPGEHSINAFAAGFAPGDAVIAVSQGSLDYLTRDELQGVIGHEFSHILNGDMKLNLRLIGLLHGILLIGLIGYTILRWGSTDSGSSRRSGSDGERRDSGAQLFLLGAALFAIGYIGVFFGRLIKAAISRQREFLADASAVQFTRNPDGIAGALKKIGGLAEGSAIKNPNAEQACHMFFGQGVSAWMEALATHPPLVARIKRIDPSFDGTFPEVRKLSALEDDQPEPHRERAGRGAPFLRSTIGTAVLGGAGGQRVSSPFEPSALVASVGTPTQKHVAFADALLATLPEHLLHAAREPFSSRAVVYALLMDPAEHVRQIQLAQLDRNSEPGTAAEIERLAPLIAALDPSARVPLVDLTLPALRGLSPSQYATFRANVDALAAADQQVSLFEFVLQHMLLRHLDRHFRARPPARVRFQSPAPLLGDISVVLSTLAHLGQDHPEHAARAFAHGARALGAWGQRLVLISRDQCTLKAVDHALNRLADAAPSIKKGLLDACAGCIAADGYLAPDEGELLRAIADSLDCPIPPLLLSPSSQQSMTMVPAP